MTRHVTVTVSRTVYVIITRTSWRKQWISQSYFIFLAVHVKSKLWTDVWI